MLTEYNAGSIRKCIPFLSKLKNIAFASISLKK